LWDNFLNLKSSNVMPMKKTLLLWND
jgi:hypothetical protein